MALSNAERQQRHRDKWGPTINKNRILRRVAKKGIPQMDSMQTHNITLPIINTIRDESKLPLIYEPYQLSEERGVPMKDRGKTKYAQVIQIEAPPPIPPRFTTPAPMARVPRKARVASSMSASSTTTGAIPEIEWLNRMTTEAPDILNVLTMSKQARGQLEELDFDTWQDVEDTVSMSKHNYYRLRDLVREYKQNLDSEAPDISADGTTEMVTTGEMMDIPTNLNGIEECIRNKPEAELERRVKDETGKTRMERYATRTIDKWPTAMTRAVEWWATSVLKDKSLMGTSGKKKLMTMDINEWLDTNIPKMVAAIPKITYKDFPRKKKDMNLADRIKHKITDITGTANTRCKPWGEFFKDNYQERWKMLTEAMGERRFLQDKEALEKGAKEVANDWRPVMARAAKALSRKMPKNPTYKQWEDDLMLIMNAAPDMHPVRDNFGAIKIVQSAADVPERTSTQTQLSDDGKTEVNVVDYLVVDEKQIIYRTHKTRVSHGQVKQPLPTKVFKKIMDSLRPKKDGGWPREWLFIQPSTADKPIKQQKPLGKGKASAIMEQKHVIGVGINTARHDFITWYAHSKRNKQGGIIPRTGLEEDAMARKMMTSQREYQNYKRFGQYVG